MLLNTNGVRIAQDDAFAAELAATFRYGKFQLYLQFDGVQEAGQQFLRGADLRATRERCLERCREMKLPVTLAMTVTPENLPFLWEAIEFGLRWPNVRGICFQPMFTSGRVPGSGTAPKRLPHPPEHRRHHPGRRRAIRRQIALRGFHAAAVRRSELRDHRLSAQGRRAGALGERLH